MAIVDTAISASEDKARAPLSKNNLFSISTNHTTLDFAAAVETGLSYQYDLLKLQAQNWIEKYIEIRRQQILTLRLDPWSDKSPSAMHVMQEMGNYYDRFEAGRPIRYSGHVCSSSQTL